MVTKWKNRILLIICSLFITIGIVGLYTVMTKGSHYLHKDYFHTATFTEELEQFTTLLHMTKMDSSSFFNMSIDVTDEEVDYYRYRDGTLDEQIKQIEADYDRRIKEVKRQTDDESKIEQMIIERDEKIEAMTNLFVSDDAVYDLIYEEKLDMLHHIEQTLKQYMDELDYYFVHVQTDDIYTNVGKSESIETHFTSEDMLFSTDYDIEANVVNEYTEKYALIAPTGDVNDVYTGKIGVAKSSSSVAPMMKAYDTYKEEKQAVWTFIMVSFILLIAGLVIIKYKSGILPDTYEPTYGKLPLDVMLLGVLLTSSVASYLLLNIADLLPHLSIKIISANHVSKLMNIIISTIFVGLTMIQMRFIKRIFLRKTKRDLWKQSLTFQFIQLMRVAFMNRTLGMKVFLFTSIIFLLGSGMLFVFVSPLAMFIYFSCLMLFGIMMFVILARKTEYFNQITEQATTLAHGGLGEKLPIKGKADLARLSQHMNVLKDVLEQSRGEQAKSERLKSELITNVSHDLRTPLTSIITYVDLLKREKIETEGQQHYINVIDEKAKGLKILIDDLFDISNMTSGNVELHLAKVDLIQLLQQTLGEYDDKINEQQLQVRLSHPESSVHVQADGQKLWRVFSNLVNNLIKYTLENTRVYIDVMQLDDRYTIVFKNISKYELAANDEELIERFKRGDSSRHTDGYGLGLAIAMSIIHLHDGTFTVETDGDLFKVTMTLKRVDE